MSLGIRDRHVPQTTPAYRGYSTKYWRSHYFSPKYRRKTSKSGIRTHTCNLSSTQEQETGGGLPWIEDILYYVMNSRPTCSTKENSSQNNCVCMSVCVGGEEGRREERVKEQRKQWRKKKIPIGKICGQALFQRRSSCILHPVSSMVPSLD